jgi:protein-S-isoprenylcysteine O-methyltransferase Ste14
MIAGLAYTLIGLSLVTTIWGLVTFAVNKPPGAKQLIFAAVVELVTVVQSVIGLARLALGFRPPELATTIGYLLVILILVPLAWFWANSERTRFSGVVLAIAGLSVFGMTLRLLSLWTPAVPG